MSADSTTHQKVPMTVLVVDDQFTIRKAMCRILANHGFTTILEANNGTAALKLLGVCAIDLVITDLFMPEVDGFETLKNIRTMNFGADIPVIVVTGEGGRDEIVKAIDLGADDYILKPFQLEDLEKKIHSVLTRYKSPTPLLKLLRDGDRLYLTGKFTDALKCFEAAERLSADNFRAKLCKALTLKNLGLTAEALEILHTITEKNPTFYRAFRAIGDIAVELAQTPLAIQAIARELELNPKQPARQIQFARLLSKEGDLLGALDHFRAALSESPKNKEALVEAGLTLGELGEIKQALTYFRRARRYYSSWTKPLELATQLLTTKVGSKEAFTFLTDELSRNPDRPDLRILVAKFLVRENDFSGAIKVLDDGLRRLSQNLPILKAKAALLKRNHHTGLACEIYQDVLKIEPSHTNQLLLANALMLDKQFQAAYDLLSSPVDASADQTSSHLMMIEALKNLNRPVQALHILERLKTTNNETRPGIDSTQVQSLRAELIRLRHSNAQTSAIKKRAS
jgi:DNA-binding response OmpR family regulator/Flp pilus assembly protein TadD